VCKNRKKGEEATLGNTSLEEGVFERFRIAQEKDENSTQPRKSSVGTGRELYPERAWLGREG